MSMTIQIGVEPSKASLHLRQAIAAAPELFAESLDEGTAEAADVVRRNVINLLLNGSPEWPELAEKTVKDKMGKPWNLSESDAERPLLRERILLDFFKDPQRCIIPKQKTTFVGIPPGVKRTGARKQGNADVELRTVGLVQEFGAYMVTNGALVHVPARPFMRPASDAAKPAVERAWAGKVAGSVGTLLRMAKEGK
jgi:hypothetical protein